jgi:hypothetical protein
VIGHLQAVSGGSRTTLEKLHHSFLVQPLVWRLIPGQISPENDGWKEARFETNIEKLSDHFFLPREIPP